jgi:hypothetical protein
MIESFAALSRAHTCTPNSKATQRQPKEKEKEIKLLFALFFSFFLSFSFFFFFFFSFFFFLFSSRSQRLLYFYFTPIKIYDKLTRAFGLGVKWKLTKCWLLPILPHESI